MTSPLTSPAASPAPSPLTFQTWTAALSARGWTVLRPSHPVPVQLWLRAGDEVRHFFARGTRFVLRSYSSSDLTSMILRAECDCAEHRTAGAGHRTVLVPGAVPLDEVVLDGRATFGWSTYEAGLADVPTAAGVLESLLARSAERQRLADHRHGLGA